MLHFLTRPILGNILLDFFSNPNRETELDKAFVHKKAVLESWSQCYKTIYARNLLIFVIGWSVCPWQDFQTYSYKYSSLLPTLVNYGRKIIYNIGPSRHIQIIE